MKIPFISKKGEKEQREIDTIIEENVKREGMEIISEEEEEKEEEEVLKEEIGKSPEPESIKKVMMDVERLNAQIEALRQMNKVAEERFSRITEEIGELRRAEIEIEKDVNKIKIEAEKASQLVSQVQPEKLMMEVEKEDVKVQTIDAKEKADRTLIDHLVNEVKEVKLRIEAFRGVESLIELNEEVKKELMNLKKIETVIKGHADRVENIFIKTEKSFNKFIKLSQEFKTLEERFNEVMKESEKFRSSYGELPKREDFEKFKNEIEEKLRFIDKTKDDFEKKRNELDKLTPKVELLVTESEELKEKLGNRLLELDDELSKMDRMEKANYVTEEKFNKELEDFFKSILEKIEKLERKIEEKKG